MFHNPYSIKSALAATIREKEGSYTIEEIFKRFTTPQELFNATVEEFLQIKGIGPVKSKQIVSALRLARLFMAPEKPTIIRSPKDIFDLLRDEIGYEQREHFVCIHLNTKNHVIGTETIAIGSLNACIVHPRELLRACIRKSAASIVVAHNHPSGDTTPSREDIELTTRVSEAAAIIGIDLLDHVIVSSQGFTSLKEKGLF